MSHHFDTSSTLEDPRTNLCDFYLFRGRPGTAVMVMTVNPDAGVSAPESFHEKAIYTFRFDLDGDTQEELAFKVRFGSVENVRGGEQGNSQRFEIRRATGPAAPRGVTGQLIVKGRTGELVETDKGVKAFAGLAPDLFAGDAAALEAFTAVFYGEGRFTSEAFQNRREFFVNRNITAIILEVPIKLIGNGLVHGWATVSLYNRTAEVQVSRRGLPLITNIFMPGAVMREAFNRATPKDDRNSFGNQIGHVVETLTTLASSATDPSDYAIHLIARLCPTALPYDLNTVAAFDCDGFNGRPLADDAMDVMLRLATNIRIYDGVALDRTRLIDEFPYFGKAFSRSEQTGVGPVTPGAKSK